MNGASDWCGRKPDDPKPIIYHGGFDLKGLNTLVETGERFFAASYLSIFPKTESKFLTAVQKASGRLFFDSGAFTFLRMFSQGKLSGDQTAYLKAYTTFIQNSTFRPDFYVTFDYQPNAEITWSMTRKLQQLGIRPVPVYHGDASIDWVKKYIDKGHRIICLSKRFFLNDRNGLHKFYDQVFQVTERESSMSWIGMHRKSGYSSMALVQCGLHFCCLRCPLQPGLLLSRFRISPSTQYRNQSGWTNEN